MHTSSYLTLDSLFGLTAVGASCTAVVRSLQELAPGVQFGADGLPELPADGGGLPPELAQQCCLQ